MKFVYKNKEYELEDVIDSETGELLSEDKYLLVENVYGDIRTFLPISLTQRDRMIEQKKNGGSEIKAAAYGHGCLTVF